ncbi:hypothetical protein VP464E531_P0062 [Vibrio phage 464E53-1]|nr:hypothetical protein VP464E531_P0062 [Vibrio phage 464E53-1]
MYSLSTVLITILVTTFLFPSGGSYTTSSPLNALDTPD